MKPKKKDKKIILASSSERRIELFKSLQIPFEVMPSEFEELDKNNTELSGYEFASHNAVNKARDIARKVDNAVVIGMDTIVLFQNKIIGKSEDAVQAKKTIEMLNNTTHSVITGISIIDADDGIEVSGTEETQVSFDAMTDNEIDRYIELGEWEGKSGAFAIQGIGALFIKEIKGDYFNVVGFPVYQFSELMKEFGMPLLDLIRFK